jgi:pimeloyl-ACP methyl ester carboxylesterase
VAKALEADYDLIMVDARGHGQSDKPETGYSALDHAADLAGLIEGLGLDKPAVLGHSMGAMTTATAAATYPDLIGYALLEDPPWREEREQSPQDREKFMAEWHANLMAQKAKSQTDIAAAGQVRSPQWDLIEFEPWSQAKLQVTPVVLQPRPTNQPSWQDSISKISCPTLLITGDPDLGAIVSAETAHSVTAQNDKIQSVHIPGAGHNIRREQFDQFLVAVTSFLQAVGYH